MTRSFFSLLSPPGVLKRFSRRLKLLPKTGDQLREILRWWLSPLDQSANHNAAGKARRSGAAEWLTQRGVYEEWKKAVHGKRTFPSFFFCAYVDGVMMQNEITSRELCMAGFGLDGKAGTTLSVRTALGAIFDSRRRGIRLHHIITPTQPSEGDFSRCQRGHARIRWETPNGTLWWRMCSMKYPDNTRDTLARTKSSCNPWSKLVPCTS
jgi:hypothetical protein